MLFEKQIRAIVEEIVGHKIKHEAAVLNDKILSVKNDLADLVEINREALDNIVADVDSRNSASFSSCLSKIDALKDSLVSLDSSLGANKDESDKKFAGVYKSISDTNLRITEGDRESTERMNKIVSEQINSDKLIKESLLAAIELFKLELTNKLSELEDARSKEFSIYKESNGIHIAERIETVKENVMEAVLEKTGMIVNELMTMKQVEKNEQKAMDKREVLLNIRERKITLAESEHKNWLEILDKKKELEDQINTIIREVPDLKAEHKEKINYLNAQINLIEWLKK